MVENLLMHREETAGGSIGMKVGEVHLQSLVNLKVLKVGYKVLIFLIR